MTNLKKNISRGLLHILIILAAFTWILPTLGVLISSFRPEAAVLNTGWWTVFTSPLELTRLTLANYQRVFETAGMAMAFRNSFSLAVVGTLLPVIVAAFAAFGFSRLNFTGRKVFFAAMIGPIVVPLQMTFIPILRIYNSLGLSGTFSGVWLAHTGYGLPFAVFMLHNFFSALPKDLFEAAYIDGASIIGVFFRLALPLSVPALASLVIFQFLWVWNDLLVALIYLGGTRDVAPLTLRLSSLVGSQGQSWHLLTSAAFISIVVPVIVFIALQQYFVRGILAGSVKG